MPVWAQLVTSVAALRVAVALALLLSGLVDPSAEAPIPIWAYSGLSLAFGALGAMLVVANRHDARAAWLGGALLLIAAPLTSPILLEARGGVGSWWHYYVRPDAFLPAFLWRFVLVFPAPLVRPGVAAATLMATLCAAAGALTAGVNLSLALWPAAGAGVDPRALLAVGEAAGVVYWLVVFLPSLAAFLALLGRLATSAGANRRRLRLFVGGLVAGMLPVFLEVVVESLSPAYRALAHAPTVEPWVGLVLFGALGTVPFVTTYSVLFDQVVDLKFVVRAALQYLLARYTILAAAAVPFVALGLYLVEHRTESLASLFAGPRPILLLAGVAAGALALRLRQAWLEALDRKYFREQYDARLLLQRVTNSDFLSQLPADIASALAIEIDRSLHATADVFVADNLRKHLVDPRGSGRSLATTSMLAMLAMADAKPMLVKVGADSAWDRLPELDKAWLASGRYQLLAGLRTRDGEPAGLLALGEKRSGLPYSSADRELIAALCGPLTLALEHQLMRNTPEAPLEMAARECLDCSRLQAPDAVQCSCGGALAEGTVPHMLRGTFRFEQRIGAGGMGVVYRAFDLGLGRIVAIKTLPRLTSERVIRLRREAQAMASVQHANLAVIYGIETWRGIPFLVEEYMAGGTLLPRLGPERWGLGQAVDLGMTLAGVLERLHASGIVHCDVKPSNIGFTQSDTPKLLDFGLVHLMRRSHESDADTPTATLSESSHPVDSFLMTDRGVMGTPPYMSPEAIRAHQPSPSFDIWALSVVLYELITGHQPFAGRDVAEIFGNVGGGVFTDPRATRKDCPDEVGQFFAAAFAPDLSQRLSNARALHGALSDLRVAVG